MQVKSPGGAAFLKSSQTVEVTWGGATPGTTAAFSDGQNGVYLDFTIATLENWQRAVVMAHGGAQRSNGTTSTAAGLIGEVIDADTLRVWTYAGGSGIQSFTIMELFAPWDVEAIKVAKSGTSLSKASGIDFTKQFIPFFGGQSQQALPASYDDGNQMYFDPATGNIGIESNTSSTGLGLMYFATTLYPL